MNAIQEAQSEGYRVPRSSELSREARDIDGAIAGLAKCAKCGNEGMFYLPLVKVDGAIYRYRAFMQCPVCDHIVEF